MMTLEEFNKVMQDISRDLALGQAKVEQNGKWFHIFITAEEFCGKSQGSREPDLERVREMP